MFVTDIPSELTDNYNYITHKFEIEMNLKPSIPRSMVRLGAKQHQILKMKDGN